MPSMSESSIYYPASLREEELKNKVAKDWFAAFDTTRIIAKQERWIQSKHTAQVGRERRTVHL